MTGRTHDLTAFTALLVVFLLLPEIPDMSFATAVAVFGFNFIGGLFPDIDQPTSDFWDNFRLGPFVAKVVCPALGGHRHFSHSVLGLVVIGWGSKQLFEPLSGIILIDFELVWWSFMIGVVAHIIMDLPTKDGVPLLWPVKVEIGIPPIKRLRMRSGKFTENYIVFPGFLLLTGYLLISNQEKIVQFIRAVIN